MKNHEEFWSVWNQIDSIEKQTRWAGDNIGTLIRALVTIAENPEKAKNIARNTLDDIGIKINYKDEK